MVRVGFVVNICLWVLCFGILGYCLSCFVGGVLQAYVAFLVGKLW